MKTDVSNIKKNAMGLINNNFMKNTGWMVFERLFQMLISLVVGLLTARYLGPENYGIINYVASFVSFATPLCNLGLEGVLVKKYIDSPEKVGKYLGTAMVAEFLISVTSASVIVIVVGLSNAGNELKIQIAILQSLALLFKSTEPIEYWYQSKLQSKYTSIIKMCAYACMSIYKVILLLTHKSVVWFAFSTSLDLLVIAVMYLVLFKKKDAIKLSVSWLTFREMLSESYHFIFSGLMVVLYTQMDKVMLNSMMGDTSVGLYSAASTINGLWYFVPGAIIASARPLILSLKNKDSLQYLSKLKQLYAVIFLLGIFVGVIFMSFSKVIIYILYGADYMGAAETFAILGWCGLFAHLGDARGIWILAEKKNKYVKYYLMIGVVVNLYLNFVLIRRIGIMGAALATIITQFTTCVVAPLFFKETRIHTKILIESVLFLKKSLRGK